MKKIRNRIKLMVACTAASIACIGVGAVGLNRATALAEEPSTTFWVPGASVKYVHNVEQQETQDGLRFAIAVENDVFDSWLNAEQTAFAEGISVGALVAPQDLVDGDALTMDTQLSQGNVVKQEFSFEDFSNATLAEYAGCKMAYVYLYDIPTDAYNREYMVAAYCDNNGEVTYTNTLARSIAWVALQAKENGDPNAEMLAGYLRKYAVNVYVNGKELTGSQMEVVYGDKIDASKLPEIAGGKIAWYADETFETEFDFEQAVTGTTNVYGKYQTSAELSGGAFSRLDEDFVVGEGDNLTLTQALQNSSARKGYAELNVEAGSDFYVSADLSLTRWIAVASQGWSSGGENDRFGFALVNANGENYRMQLRSVMAAVLTYAKSDALYGGDPATSNYLLGKTNGTTNEVYASGYIQLKNTDNMNNVTKVTLAMSKVGNNLFFYVNGELVAVQEIEADFNGVPALFAYSFADKPAQVITYSNITIGEGVAPTYGVSFNVDGEELKSTTVAYGNVIDSAVVPASSAGTYTWYADEAMETEFDFTQAITADTVVYGKFAINEYDVVVYVNGEENVTLKVTHGDTIDQAQLPTFNKGVLAWYADETFETAFDFAQTITGTTNVYGKYDKYVDMTDGLFTQLDDTFAYDSENATLTQALQNSYARKGYAELNVEAGSDFYVSADLSLTKWIAVASQGWNAGGENDRFGFALVNANGENYRMQLRSVMAAVLTYAKSEALYGGDPATSNYLLGKDNGTSNEVYASGYIKLKNTGNMNNVTKVTLAMSKVGNNLFFYVNGELVAAQEIAADFNGVPALFAYSFASPSAQVITYSNITIGEGVAPSFGVNFKVAGENVASTTVVYGNVIGESALPTTSAGVYTWYVDEAMETEFDFAQAIMADTVIYGKLTLNEYDVVVYIDGEEKVTLKVAHGNAIDQTQLPTVEKGKLTWYADETFATAFDFAQTINGTVSVYGKYQSVYDLTGGTFTDADSDYAISGEGESLKLTQALGHGTEGGFAYFNVKDSDAYSISVDIKLSGVPATAAQGVNQGADARVGFALINPETQQNYRFLFRPTQTALIFYDITSDLYELRSGSDFEESKGAVTYVYGKTNSTPKEPKLVLQNTASINGSANINLTMTKVGDTVSVYLNGELWTTKTVEDGFAGVPALLSYSLDGKTRSHTYSNVAITTCTTKCAVCELCDDENCALHTTKCVETLGYFGEHTSDYKAVKDSNGKWTVSQTLSNGKGLAYLGVTDNNNYQISVDIKLSNNPATAAQGVNDGVDARVGFALINPETSENYRFLFRPTQTALIYYDKSTELYELRSGSDFEESKGAVTYVYGKTNSTPKTPKLVLQNTGAINNNPNIKLTIAKLNDTVSVYLNGELWTTVTVEAGFAGVPALFSYCLDGKTRVHTYSNVAIKTCVETCETCGLCPDANCLIHNSTKCVSAIGFGEHTSDYKAVNSNGNWTVSQALGNGKDGKGLAYLGVSDNNNYQISVDIKLSNNPATAAQGVNDGVDARVGFALINPETNENYRFLFRPTQTALIYYDKSTDLYELRSGSDFEESKGAVTYVYGKTNSTPKTPKLVLQNTGAINNNPNIKLTIAKLNDTVSVYLNGELWTTKTVEDGFAGVPALLSYSLDGKTRSHTYSNIVIEAVANA